MLYGSGQLFKPFKAIDSGLTEVLWFGHRVSREISLLSAQQEASGRSYGIEPSMNKDCVNSRKPSKNTGSCLKDIERFLSEIEAFLKSYLRPAPK